MLTDCPDFLDYARTFEQPGGQWDFRLQFYYADVVPDPDDFSILPIVRFQWSDVALGRTGLVDLVDQDITRGDDYEPQFDFANLGDPPWPVGTWIERVRVGGLIFDGDDAAAEYRATQFA